MHAIDAQAVPEQLIAELNRRRHWKMVGALSALVLALAALFAATMAMYSDDPASSLQQPASVAER
jgi:hypothetical protein